MNRVSAPVAPSARTTASRLTDPKCSSNLARSWPLSALQTHSITASMCISNLARLQPPWSHDHGHQGHLQTRSETTSKCISKLARLRLPSLHDHGLQVHLQTRSITSSKRMFEPAQTWPCSASLSSFDHGVVKRWRQPIINAPLHIAWYPKGEFACKSDSSLRSVGWGWEDMKGYPAMMNHTNWVDLWKICKSVWGSTQIVWIYESSATVHITKSWER